MVTKYHNSRFHGKVWEEYELFKLACPHFDDLEKNIGLQLQEHFWNEAPINILEIWCWPGYTTQIILNSLGKARVVAVDNEPVMISQAQIVLQESIISGRVKLVCEDALSFLKTQNNSIFDAFVSGFTLHNIPWEVRECIIKEILRVLKPWGIFINADKYALDNTADHNESLRWQIGKFKEEYLKINRVDLAEEWISHYLDDNHPSLIMIQESAIQSMMQIGFVGIAVIFREQMDAVLIANKPQSTS